MITSINTVFALFGASSVSMMRLEAEATVVFDMAARLGSNLPLLAPSMVFLQCPHTRTIRNVNIWMAVIYIQHTLFLVERVWTTDIQARIAVTDLLQVVLAFYCWRMSFVFWLNLAWAPVASYASEQVHMQASPCASGIRVHSELVACVVEIAIHLASRQMLLKEIHHEVRAAKSIEDAFETLLHGMCEAVVHLDKDLNQKRSCRQLDALLLRSSGADCPYNFVNLLQSDDRERFCASIQHPEVDTASGHVEEGHIANVIHVDMLNTYGIPVHTSIHYTSYNDTMGNLCHMVGIREWSDWDETPGILVCGNDDSGFAEAARARRWQRLRDDCESSHTGQSSTRSNASLMTLDTEHKDVSVWVQASTAMPMMKCTAGFFTHFGGPSLSHQTSLTNWLPRTDRKEIFAHFQRVVSAFLLLGEERTETFNVMLQPPHLRGQAFLVVSASIQTQPSAVANAIGAVADDDMDTASERQKHRQRGSRDTDSEAHLHQHSFPT